MNSDFLLKVADVLEAVAEEKSTLQEELNTIKQAERQKRVEPLAQQFSHLGEAAVEKLSQLDDDTLDLITKVAGTDAPQLGGATKLASAGRGQGRADDAFASWILS